VITLVRNVIDRVDQRLAAEDALAEHRGWSMRRTGRFDWTRVYRDPRWDAVQDAEEASASRFTVTLDAEPRAEIIAVGQRWASLPDHLTQEEKAPYVQG
jgi:hypothetical protein